MRKYQITEVGENGNHAGTKGTADIAAVADSLGFERCIIKVDLNGHSAFSKMRRQIFYCLDYKKALKQIEPGSIVLLQHPFHHKQINREKTLLELKNGKHVKFICVVHDVEELREYRDSDYYKKEFETMMTVADVIIVHNAKMLEWFVSKGFPADKLVNLEIFDYLHTNEYVTPSFERSVSIAGNLDVQKCKYIAGLKDVEGTTFRLYGPNYDDSLSSVPTIHYEGSFPSNEINSHLTSGFGLVWDGEGISGCIGKSGQYLKYNNPHKLSLYLSSGLPVVIWEEAAEVSFVKENGVGLTVRSLTELGDALNKIDEKCYYSMVERVKSVRERLISGYYARTAIGKAETLIG